MKIMFSSQRIFNLYTKKPARVKNLLFKKIEKSVDAGGLKFFDAFERSIDALGESLQVPLTYLGKKIDEKTSPGTAQKLVDVALMPLGLVFFSHQFVVLFLSLCRANVCGIPCERIQNGSQEYVQLYRGLTSREIDLVLDNPDLKGGLFGETTKERPLDFRATYKHVTGMYHNHSDRVFTSFSSHIELANKFSRPIHFDRQFGATACFHVPLDVFRYAKFGLHNYREVLIPTHLLKLSMIQSVEVRSYEELVVATQNELTAALWNDADGIKYSHKFETPPMLFFNPKDPDAHMEACRVLKPLMGDKVSES